ncbi:high-affinity branched-chain amino acid transport ATP-binding protein LivF [Geobacter sp. OR-1]|uniref:ABC transporter ATP-binding protein n=1 Tax=Geobacter sp. OR-1 TaxID=1266765 RepID=UPI0005421B96|nr:ABC transporter ATP-binding protein [Geobacter sp. OR-1]GAM07807.1 high-affinity branched-chain amino acid transport ATP-binding protein LivF [Geobacter sp. OR-1]
MLEIRNIDVCYGDVQVVWDVSFSVQSGEIAALIGANGAGKSTILKTISGIVKPSGGKIIFDGKEINQMEPYDLIETGLAHVPEARRLFVEMTVEENLDLGSLKGNAKKLREETKTMVYELFPRLKERRKQLAGTLSGGEQQMVAIGRGLMSKPKLIMFDEPSLGLAPILVRDIFEVIKTIRSEGMTILIVEQNVKLSLAIADKAYVLASGKLVMEGTGATLLDNEHIKTAYLGV